MGERRRNRTTENKKIGIKNQQRRLKRSRERQKEEDQAATTAEAEVDGRYNSKNSAIHTILIVDAASFIGTGNAV